MSLDSGSDSDSDLEFLAGQGSYQSTNSPVAERQSRPTAKRPNGPGAPGAPGAHSAALSQAEIALQQQIDALQRKMWETLGENVILRSQLQNNVSHHERELGNLINQQSKVKEEIRHELEMQKKEVEKERIQIQFLQAELRSKVGSSGAMRAPSDSYVHNADGAHQYSASTLGPTRQHSTPISPSKRRTPAAALSDGFVLKKQRILPSLDASQPRSQLKPNSEKDLFTQGPNQELAQGLTQELAQGLIQELGKDSQIIDLQKLLALVATHRAPGNKANTLELLYTYRLPTGYSVGQKVSMFGSYSELIDSILELISGMTQEDDCVILLLALLHALISRHLPLEDTHKRAISTTLCTQLLVWLKHMNPLPSFASLLPPFSLSLVDLRLLTCVLYTLDILASVDWEVPMSLELSRRLLTCSCSPRVVEKAINVLCLQPQSVTIELVKLITPTINIRPTIELLFSGLNDVQLLSVAQLCSDLPFTKNTCSLAPNIKTLGELRQMAEQQAMAVSVNFQSACIQLALALQYDRAATPISMYSQVLAILTGHIDCTFPASSRVLQESVFFFWCLEPTKLRDELNEDELAELEVCLAKLVYAGDESNETVERGRQLLQALAVGTDSDLVFEAFEPLDRDQSRLMAQGSPSSVGTRL